MSASNNALDEQKIRQQVNPVFNDSHSIHVFKEISSTHHELLFAIKKGLIKNAVYLAEYQSAGKGRRGRVWQAPAGKNINFSASYHYRGTFASLHGLSLAVAVMVLRAIAGYGLKSHFQLKWPNDIYADHKKLGGILIDIVNKEINQFTVVISVGLNVNLNVTDLAKLSQTVISLLQINQQQVIDRNRLGACLINEISKGVCLYQAQGFSAFKKQWEAHHFMQGQSVVISSEVSDIVGVCRGVNIDGSLILEQNGHLTAIHSGDISLRLCDKP